VTSLDFPDGWSELDFLRAYQSTALRKPEVVADTALSSLFLAETGNRALLAAGVAQECAEAARRLLAVWRALTDRSRPVGRALLAPLPGPEEWEAFAGEVHEAPPEDLLAAMRLGPDVEESAAELAAAPGLAWYAELMRAFEGRPPIVLIAPGSPPALLLIYDNAGERRELRLPLHEESVVGLGDAAGAFIALARDFLGAYIEMREQTIRQSRGG
jgi:hypothetical protein